MALYGYAKTKKQLYFDTEKEAINYLKKNGYSTKYKDRNYFLATLCINADGKEFFGCGAEVDRHCADCTANLTFVKPNKWFVTPFLYAYR